MFIKFLYVVDLFTRNTGTAAANSAKFNVAHLVCMKILKVSTLQL